MAGSGNFASMAIWMTCAEQPKRRVAIIYYFSGHFLMSSSFIGKKANPLEVRATISHPNHPLTPLAKLSRQILSI